MRRSDREITDISRILKVIAQCQVCRLAILADPVPYILPLNFGVLARDQALDLVFHGALEGTKYQLIQSAGKASFEMDCGHTLHSDVQRGYCTMSFASVIGSGPLSIIHDEASKAQALQALCDHYHPQGFTYNPAAISRTKVFKLTVETMTCKVKE